MTISKIFSTAPMLFAAVSLAVLQSCDKRENGGDLNLSPVNLDHILSLVDSMNIGGQSLAYVNIYAEYPDYEPVTAVGEGITAVDDVGRLLEVLEVEIVEYNRNDLRNLARGLTDFLLRMQTSDGLWYNFMFSDGSINTNHVNSVASFGWWAARGLRGLAAAFHIFKDSDPALADTLLRRFQLGEHHLDASLSKYPSKVLTAHGQRASWIPSDAPDMSAEFLLSLAQMTELSSLDYRDEIQKLGEGLLTYQIRSDGAAADGMFYSWKNVWHNWGNLQALALLEAYQLSQDSTMLSSVERWANGFLTWQVDQGYLWEVTASSPTSLTKVSYPQIAYGIGSSYRGVQRLAEITGAAQYDSLASRIIGWFEGANAAGQRMYHHDTGRCYDGINSADDINLNSGAESTIEALLALQVAQLY